MKMVNGREIPDIAGELTNQEGMNMLVDLLTEAANNMDATPGSDALSVSALEVTGAATVGSTLTTTGTLRANGGVDRSTAAALALGATNASAVDICKLGAMTTVKGTLNVDQAVTCDSTLSATTVETAQITRTGALTIGDSNTTQVTVGRSAITTTIPGTIAATNITVGGDITTSTGIGSAGGANMVATEKGDGVFHQTVLTLTAHSITIDGTAVGFGASKLYDFPEGLISVIGAVVNLAITAGVGGIADDFDGDFALGTVATVDGDFGDTGEATIIASTATPQATAGVSSAKGQNSAVVLLDGTTTAADLFLNVLIDDADISANDTLLCTGTVTVTWVKLGDY